MMFLEEGQQPMAEEVSWLNHAVGVALAALGAFALMVGGAIARLWGHEGRIKALEDGRTNHASAIDALSQKVDANHAAISDRLDNNFESIRSDLRIVIARCMSVSHPERHE